MADFKQAAKWMKEGKKVRCEKWFISTLYIRQDEDPCTLILDNNGDKVDWLCSHEFEATDWEIYEESSSLSYKELKYGIICTCGKKHIVGGGLYGEADIKKTAKELKTEFYDSSNFRQDGIGAKATEIIDKIFGERLI